MSRFFIAQVTLNSITGLAKDACSNSFAFRTPDGDGDEYTADLAQAVSDFYNNVADGALISMDAMLSPVISRASDAHEVAMYDVTNDLTGTPHGSPQLVLPFDLNAPLGGSPNGYPSEVAYCITLEALGRASAAVETADGADADAKRDRPKQRYTGRIFFGPLIEGLAAEVDGVIRPGPELRDTSLMAAKQLADTVDALGIGVDWCVWSRKDAEMRPISHVSVDNSFDTQRRRGEDSTIRTRLFV